MPRMKPGMTMERLRSLGPRASRFTLVRDDNSSNSYFAAWVNICSTCSQFTRWSRKALR